MTGTVHRLPTAASLYARDDLTDDGFRAVFAAVLRQEMAAAFDRAKARMASGDVADEFIAVATGEGRAS